MQHDRFDRWHAAHAVALAVLLFALVLLAQLPLILNPGYFSHDELQWAARAARRRHAFAVAADDRRVPVPAADLQPVAVAVAAPVRAAAGLPCGAGGLGRGQCGAAVRAGAPLRRGDVAGGARRAGVRARPVCGLRARLGRHARRPDVGRAARWLVGLVRVRASAARRASPSPRAVLTADRRCWRRKRRSSIPALLRWWRGGSTGRKRTLAGGAAGVRRGRGAVSRRCACGVLLHAPRARHASTRWSLAHVPLRWLEYQLFPPIPAACSRRSHTLSRGFSDSAS